MGFVQAMCDLGSLDTGEGLDAYLKPPSERGGKLVRVFLAVDDPAADVLVIRGVTKVDLADLKSGPDMKRKYLYRDRVGSNVGWGFTPLLKIGKPKGTLEKNREDWVGPTGNWREETHCHLYKLQHRVLEEYEKTGTFIPGSVDVIMSGLEKWLEVILESLQPKESHIVLFGIDTEGRFLYPGEIPAFVHYFEAKLRQTLTGNTGRERECALCHRPSASLVSLSTIFKFATADKVSFLPGLDKDEEERVFVVCQDCVRKISAARERVERTLTSTGVIPGLRVWTIPEAVGTKGAGPVRRMVERLERAQDSADTVTTLGEKQERRFFAEMVRQEDSGLVFHFLFWERNNAQELVHLMVEDVPPERLAYLESTWNRVMKAVMGEGVKKGLHLDWMLSSLYSILSRLAGKSDSDKIVFRDFAIKVLGKLLKGETLPTVTLKQIVTSRAARLVYEDDNWSDVQRTLLYAQVWVDYMTLINQGVPV
ncbi:MAG TPA: hypothetical protein GXX50_02285 [Firmicutes bacterium]|nr:hypothetical protein [Bacillota bacterium]